jgi:hypothetical protein
MRRGDLRFVCLLPGALSAACGANESGKGTGPDAGTTSDAASPGADAPAPVDAASPADAPSFADTGGPQDAAQPPGDTGGEGASPPLGDAGPLTIPLFDRQHVGSNNTLPDFHVARAPVKLTGGPFASVKLVVDLESPCYPFDKWKTDRPPTGQNYPADCDAFDRNFEGSLQPLPTDAAAAPGIELYRAITPFGGPEHVEADVTDVFNFLTDARVFQITIPSYSDAAGRVSGSNGGWYVSAHLEAMPGAPPRNVLAVQSLLYGSIGAAQASTDLAFTLPAGTTSGRIEYRVTGHGGDGEGQSDPNCIGPADEFCKRTHTLRLDGQQIDQMQPWRGDCTKNCTLATYPPDGGSPSFMHCRQNPTGAIASVNAPRANWCPSTVTPPFVYTPAALGTPGAHTFHLDIANIAPSASWETSVTVFAFGS